MLSTDIKIWYNNENSYSAKFSEFLNTDLVKCLMRFGITSVIETNPDIISKSNHIIIFAEEDTKYPEYTEKCNDILSDRDTILLIIEPIRDNPLDITTISQPVLFWNKLYDTGEHILLRRDLPETQAAYWEKMTDIVTVLSTRLNQSNNNLRRRVFLSFTEITHNADRENLRRDLNDLGFDIVPDKPLSTDIKLCSDQITEALESVHLIIHIIPPIYTPYFINHQLSLAEHQCILSAEFLRNSSSPPHRIIWLASSHIISDEENQVFIERIQRDHEQTQGSTVLKSTIEDLKKLYRHILLNVDADSEQKSDAPDIYLISDNGINVDYDVLKKTLASKKVKIERNYKGIKYNQHLRMLAKASNVVLVYSQENEQWLKVKANDILKSRGLDFSKPIVRSVLVKGNMKIESALTEGRFTHIINDIDNLPSILIDNNTI